MNRLLEIAPGVFLQPSSVTVVKKGEEGQSVLFVTGQSALDGFVVDVPMEEVVDKIDEALSEDDGD